MNDFEAAGGGRQGIRRLSTALQVTGAVDTGKSHVNFSNIPIVEGGGGTRRNIPWLASRSESKSGQCQEEEVLPTHTNPMVDRQHTVTSTEADNERSVF
jgi:hypothetical protein